MGCKSSKLKAKTPQADGASPTPESTPARAQAKQPLETKSSEALTPAHGGRGGEADDGRRSNAPKEAAERTEELDAEGNPLLLPGGEWVKTQGTPFYYCEKENLYYHPPSFQFYDPTNEMWYDPEKNEWYNDDKNDS